MRPIENKDELMSEIKRLLNLGYSQQKVADTLKIGQNTVSFWLREEKKDIETRTKGETKCKGCRKMVEMKPFGTYRGAGELYKCPKCKSVQSLEPKQSSVTICY